MNSLSREKRPCGPICVGSSFRLKGGASLRWQKGLWAFEHKQLGVQNIDGFVVLIQHRAANSDHGLVRFGSRWGDGDDFAFDAQKIAGARRPRPSDVAAQT